MTLLEKLMLKKAEEEAEIKPKSLPQLDLEIAKKLGLKSGVSIKAMRNGTLPNGKTLVKMEKMFGYSAEELIAKAK